MSRPVRFYKRIRAIKYTKQELLTFIREAYAATGLKPIANTFLSDCDTYACPVVALHCQFNMNDRSSWTSPSCAVNTVARALDVNHSWVLGFFQGFDYHGRADRGESFEYGAYIRKRLLPQNT